MKGIGRRSREALAAAGATLRAALPCAALPCAAMLVAVSCAAAPRAGAARLEERPGGAAEEWFFEEDAFEASMKDVALPFLAALRETGSFEGEAGAVIHTERYRTPGAAAVVVLSHGFGESIAKFDEIIYYAAKAGFAVYAIEHRGHGRSGHLGKDSSQIHVEDYGHYVADLGNLVEAARKENPGSKVFLFAHSMGGGIGAVFLERNPAAIDAAVLTAPMLEIDTGKVGGITAGFVAGLNVAFGGKLSYVFGEGPYTDEPYFETCGTSSRARYYFYHERLLADPSIRNGGASFGWLSQALALTREAAANAEKATMPILLFQADLETYVRPGGQARFAAKAPRCELVFVPGAKHEIYRERDSILAPYLDRVFAFYRTAL